MNTFNHFSAWIQTKSLWVQVVMGPWCCLASHGLLSLPVKSGPYQQAKVRFSGGGLAGGKDFLRASGRAWIKTHRELPTNY